jgi:transmembrane sensor
LSQNNNHINNDLLVKYLLGEASPPEKDRVEDWMVADPANQHYFDQFRRIWEKSRELALHLNPDEEAAWQRFRKRIREPKKTNPVSRIPWMRIAALFILFAGAGVLTYSLLQESTVRHLVAVSGNSIKTDTLVDGSVITLNKNSSLTYPSRFNGETRSVELKGEAFFQVKPDKKKPFIVQVNDVTIKVLGTSFNIRSRNGETEVIVETGIVQVVRNNRALELRPGEKTVVHRQDLVPVKTKEDQQLYNYYKTREFVCDNTPLWKLVEVLNEAYDINIVIESEAIRSLRLTTTFSNESPDRILQIISETFQVKMEHVNGKIIIR